MVKQADIISYARTRKEFTCREMLSCFRDGNISFSPATVTSCLLKLTETGVLRKIRRGVYSMTDSRQQIFIPYYDETMASLESMIRNQFPFIRFCVWNTSDIKRFSHYVINIDVIYVDVECIAKESVFTFLINANLDRQVYLNPSVDDYSYYIFGKPTIVVRNLISESPLIVYSGKSNRVALEKLLVDIVVDDDFNFLHDYESIRFYRNVMDTSTFSESKLLRYSSRRGCKDKIKNLLDTVKQEEIID